MSHFSLDEGQRVLLIAWFERLDVGESVKDYT
jgi:hypothetical protein